MKRLSKETHPNFVRVKRGNDDCIEVHDNGEVLTLGRVDVKMLTTALQMAQDKGWA